MAADIAFDKMSVDDLNAVISGAQEELAAREQKIKDDALSELRALAQKAGLSAADVAAALRGTSRKRTKVPAKYRNPANALETWSGRGKRPRWVSAALSAGKNLEDLAIAA